jgi:hypothetical protein
MPTTLVEALPHRMPAEIDGLCAEWDRLAAIFEANSILS